jgi:hypothetical protein
MLRRYSPIWAGMGVLRDITLALYAAEQLCKARGTHSCVLLDLLLEMDAGRYLEVSARKNVELEITTYAQVGDGNLLRHCFVLTHFVQGSATFGKRDGAMSEENSRNTHALK